MSPRRSTPRDTHARLRTACALTTVITTVVGAGVLAPWAGASSADASTLLTGPDTSVTLVLAAPDADALEALAAQPITHRAQRLAQVAALLPSAAQRAAVAATLTGDGYDVTSETSWSVTATAAQGRVTQQFGVAQPDDGTLPDLPTGLGDRVDAAYLTTTDEPTFGSSATTSLTGADVRRAGTAAGVAPLTGAKDAGLTIATLQLASWNSADLTSFAAYAGLSDPVASGRYRAIAVDGGSSTTDGQLEVAVDQESILATAPTAQQAAYFAPNSLAGFSDGLSSVLDDVTGAAGASEPDPHIAALSISWGQCESGWRSTGINTVEPILAALTAAGVTIFAASGDDGIYDCHSPDGTGRDNSQEDVDFPASSPFVVAVGGTRLSSATVPSTAYDGSNWTESAWSCTDPVSCQSTGGTGGSGGGVSGSAYRTSGRPSYFAGFARPSYQTQYVTTGPFAAPAHRMVPDISADGDPASGMAIFSHDPATGSGHLATVGGTSLAAPLSAAQLVNLLGDCGVQAGVGDVHAALYRAYAETSGLAPSNPARVFRDVVTGANGSAVDAHVDPSVQAQPGYDTVTGLGGVLWPALAPYLSLPTPDSSPAVGAPGTVPSAATTTVAKSPSGSRHSRHRRVRHKLELTVRLSGVPGHRTATVLARWRTVGPGRHTTVRLTGGAGAPWTGHQASGHTQIAAGPGRYTLTVSTRGAHGHVRTSVRHLTVGDPGHR